VTDSDRTELRAEQEVVDRAYARLEAMRDEARALANDVLDQGEGGTFANRIERDVRMEARGRRLAELQVGEAGLVFGRMDAESGDRLYIGRVAVSDEENEPLIVDWRAPAAEPFYRATARHAMGLARRRHLILKGRRVVGLDDELLGERGANEDEANGLVLVGEGALFAALERSRTGRMGDIVATIQREQDEIIRAPLPGILVVQGGPGTGKTAVALHRAAYLLYTHRFPLERSGVLLVGPNRIFLRYIERVLPALGERSATLATPATLAGTPVRGIEPVTGARLKGDPRMAAVIQRAVLDRERGLPDDASVLWFGHRLVLSGEASWRIARQVRRRPGTHNARRPVIERLVARHLQRQLPDEEDWDSFEDSIRREPPIREALERMWPVLSPEDLLHDLFGSPALIRSAGRKLLSEDEERLLQRPRRAPGEEIRWTDADVALLDEAAVLLGPRPPRGARRRNRGEQEARRWERQRVMADLGELDAQMRRDVLRHLEEGDVEGDVEHLDLRTRTYGHILVDEAQDLSPMQLRMLGRRCPAGSMTLVGDLGQASGPWAPSSWDDVLAHLPLRRPPAHTELSVNYRTPAEVMELAARVLAAATPGLRPPDSVRSAGLDPVFTYVRHGGIAAAVAAAAEAERQAVGDGKVAVICPGALLPQLRTALPEVPEGESVLDVPVALLAVDDAKGLEFDSVVLVEPAGIVAQGSGTTGRRALYVAMTRTTRRLHIVHADPLPPELVRADARMAG
jgi:DNA helicase IV